MTDTTRDDAPLTASKRSEAADEAGRLIPEARGSSLVGNAVTIRRPAADLYAFWRDFANLPQVLDNVVSITPTDAQRSHWVVKAPGGRTVEWDARITEERDGELIAWTSEEGADVPNSGRITFREAGERGTVVTAHILYDPPGGVIGKVVAKMFQREPKMQARRDLRRFKQLMETGEIATGARTQADLEHRKGE